MGAELGAGMGLVASWLCVRSAAPEPACLAEQMEAVKGESLGISIPAESRTRQELSSPSAFPQLSFARRHGPGLTLTWQSCLLLLQQLGSERRRLPGRHQLFSLSGDIYSATVTRFNELPHCQLAF